MNKRMSFRAGVLVGIAAIVIVMLAACGGGETAKVGDDPVVVPLPADRPEMAVEGPDGTLPCGLGEVQWGFRVFMLDDFPACKPYLPNLTVYCLGGDATWSDANLTNINASETDETISFEVQQEGICGLFPTSE